MHIRKSDASVRKSAPHWFVFSVQSGFHTKSQIPCHRRQLSQVVSSWPAHDKSILSVLRYQREKAYEFLRTVSFV